MITFQSREENIDIFNKNNWENICNSNPSLNRNKNKEIQLKKKLKLNKIFVFV